MNDDTINTRKDDDDNERTVPRGEQSSQSSSQASNTLDNTPAQNMRSSSTNHSSVSNSFSTSHMQSHTPRGNMVTNYWRNMRSGTSGGGIRPHTSGGLGYYYILTLMFLAIGGATALIGGAAPVDPNGPSGPPTLPPYFVNQEEQQLILDKEMLTPGSKDNLQLKTFKVNTCSQPVAIDFLLDTSGSMRLDNKSGKMKTALKAFTDKLGGTSAIAIQTFSASTKDRVPFDYYRINKAQVNATIGSLPASGWTSTRDGLNLAKTKLSEAISANKFPGYKYYLIFITDGIPEQPGSTECLVETNEPIHGRRCFSKEQDPRNPPNVASEIKKMGVTLYSIGIYSQSGSDKIMEPHLIAVLKDAASSPNHYFGSPNATDLSKILSTIFKSICSPVVVEEEMTPQITK